MKLLLSLSLLISLTSFVSAQTSETQKNEKSPIFLGNCSHYGAGVSYSFQSCLNSNFAAISRVTGGFFQYCTSMGSEVDYFFTSCVNSGFSEAQRQLENRIFLQHCLNFDRTQLDYSFTSCVNSNFSAIQREISKRDISN